MTKLDETRYEKLQEKAERFARQVDRKGAEVNQLNEDLMVADAELAELRLEVDTHKDVLAQTWGLWAANRRMIMSLAGMADSRKSKWLRRLLGKWLNKDQAAMVKLLDWADEQVNGPADMGSASPR